MAEVVDVGGGSSEEASCTILRTMACPMSSFSNAGRALAEGSTGRATVGFASAIDIQLSQLALQRLERFCHEMGGESEYVSAGMILRIR